MNIIGYIIFLLFLVTFIILVIIGVNGINYMIIFGHKEYKNWKFLMKNAWKFRLNYEDCFIVSKEYIWKDTGDTYSIIYWKNGTISAHSDNRGCLVCGFCEMMSRKLQKKIEREQKLIDELIEINKEHITNE